MRLKTIFIFLLVLIISKQVKAQCDSLGQTPSTAFPVCGIKTFHQTTVPYCVNGDIPVPGCENTVTYSDQNPYWYKFTCYQSGTLSFLINPNNQNEDYDWQIFDITGHNPNDVYTDASLFVVGNWAGTYGPTGTSASAPANVQCASNPNANPPVTTFSKTPNLIAGHNYLLMISHFSATPNGYSLSFTGGTAIITDTTQPRLQTATANCDGTQVTIKLNKNMQCKTLVSDGSDFSISSGSVLIKAAAGIGCSNGFDMDSVTLTLNNPLPPGNYVLKIQNGTDGNTLLDNCDNAIPVGDSLKLIVYPLQPTPMDSLTPVNCAPNNIQLVFKKNILCNSIAADGSDFVVNGPFPATVSTAVGNCTNGLSNIINVQLSQPIFHAGIYTIILQKGTDGNTIIDECGEETPAGSSLNFSAADTVSAAFNYNVFLGCKYDSIKFNHDGRNGVNQWTWVFDSTDTSHLQSLTKIYSIFNQKNAQLFVTNGVCSDTTSVNILLDNTLKAMFQSPEFLCPQDAAIFKDTSIGHIVSWNWDFGNGLTSFLQNPPPQIYPSPPGDKIYFVQLIVQDSIHCFDTAYNQLKLLYNCYIAVPSAFTPNGDGLNDYLFPLNAYKADNLEFRVYNRLGQLVFETKDWTKKWDGKINGEPQASGTYVWMLSYTNHDTGKKVFQKGTTVLIR
ncbi:MAG: gliding motility-associated C-terminal domain-containing protein [Chitinophagaceae bacterium]